MYVEVFLKVRLPILLSVRYTELLGCKLKAGNFNEENLFLNEEKLRCQSL